jgi:hypothetical protein
MNVCRTYDMSKPKNPIVCRTYAECMASCRREIRSCFTSTSLVNYISPGAKQNHNDLQVPVRWDEQNDDLLPHRSIVTLRLMSLFPLRIVL